jgi:hypothetical protein
MTGSELIEDLNKVTNENIEFAKKKLAYLNENQLNWKPNDRSWSIAEVLAHLNAYSSFYHPAFIKKTENTKFRKPTENFISSPLGRSAWKSMKLGRLKNIKRKFKAPQSYNPTISAKWLEGNVLESFLTNQDELISIFEKSKEINIRKAKSPISLSKIIKLRMGDAFMFVVYHNERHIQQIKNLLQLQDFPKK